MEEAESKIAQTLMLEPSGAWINTKQVISSVFEHMPVALLAVIGLMG